MTLMMWNVSRLIIFLVAVLLVLTGSSGHDMGTCARAGTDLPRLTPVARLVAIC